MDREREAQCPPLGPTPTPPWNADSSPQAPKRGAGGQVLRVRGHDTKALHPKALWEQRRPSQVPATGRGGDK